MNSLEDLLVFPNYTNLEIKVSHPRLPKENNYIQQKVKRVTSTKNFDNKHTNETISNILLEMNKVLKSSIFNEDKNATTNFIQQNILVNPIIITNKANNIADANNNTAEKIVAEVNNGKGIECESNYFVNKIPEREDLKRKHGKAFPNSVIGFETKKFKKQPTIGDYFKKN